MNLHASTARWGQRSTGVACVRCHLTVSAAQHGSTLRSLRVDRRWTHRCAVRTPTVSLSSARTLQGLPARSSAADRSSTGSFPTTPEQVKPLVQSSRTPLSIDVCLRAKLKQKPRIGGSPPLWKTELGDFTADNGFSQADIKALNNAIASEPADLIHTHKHEVLPRLDVTTWTKIILNHLPRVTHTSSPHCAER